MREIKADLFNYQIENLKILRCITTNGILMSTGELVMGAGIALLAKKRFPELPRILGPLVQTGGNHVYILPNLGLASFPTKHHWKDNSDLKLIEQSCKELIEVDRDWDYVLLPRVGTGNGKLQWSEVKRILINYLDSERYLICN